MTPYRPYLIGIAGATCSGKSHLARHLEQRFPEIRPVVISSDAYYRDLSGLDVKERENRNFDHPEAIEVELLRAHLADLVSGKEIHRPVYDFSTHCRNAPSLRTIPADLIIVEGLFVLHWPEIRQLLHTKVFVSLADDAGLARRLERDIRDRGRTRESILNQYIQTVKPMNDKYVLPTREFADIVVDGADPIEKSGDAIAERIESALRITDHAG